MPRILQKIDIPLDTTSFSEDDRDIIVMIETLKDLYQIGDFRNILILSRINIYEFYKL